MDGAGGQPHHRPGAAMRHRVRALAVAVSVACSLVATGCGGGHTVTKKDVIAQADGICVNTLRQVRAVPPPTGSSLTALATYADKVAPIVEKEASDTRGLPRPPVDRAVLT